MADEKIEIKAREVYNRIENALVEAVGRQHYRSAELLVKVLRQLQLRYGGGTSMSQDEDKVLTEAMETMAEVIKEPLEYQQWWNVAYCADMLAAIEDVLING